MKTQEEINKSWEQTSGGITLLEPPQRESGLRKPYQYKMAEPEILKLKAALLTALQPWKSRLQCSLVEFKRTGLGFRVTVFLLAWPNTWEQPGKQKFYVSPEDWNETANTLKEALKPLDPDAPVYVEPWTGERKFQARFETYILRA